MSVAVRRELALLDEVVDGVDAEDGEVEGLALLDPACKGAVEP